MAFPASVDTVTLTVGPLYDAGGLPRRGVPLTVTLGRLVLIDEGGAALPSVTTARTDETGEASVVLVATDSAGIDTTGWMYTVRCPGVVDGSISVALPSAVPTVAVETLAAQTAEDGSTVWTPGAVYSVGGLTGAVDLADLDAADLGSGAATDGYVLTADGAGGAAWEAAAGGGGGASALNDLTDVSTTGAATGKALTYNGTSWAPGGAAAILEGDARLTDARTPSSHTHTASEISDSTTTGRAVVTAVDAAAARTAIGAGTSSFDGAYSSLSGKPTLGTAAATDATAYATAAQGGLADSAVQPGDLDAAVIARAAVGYARAVGNVSQLYVNTPGTYQVGSWNRPAGLMTLAPIFLVEGVTLDRLGVRVGTGVGSSTIRVGVYAADLSTMQPTGEALVDTTIDGTSSGVKTATISLAVTAPVVFLAGVAQGGVDADAAGFGVPTPLGWFQDTGTVTYNDSSGYYVPWAYSLSGVTGALPDLTSASWASRKMTQVFGVTARIQ